MKKREGKKKKKPKFWAINTKSLNKKTNDSWQERVEIFITDNVSLRRKKKVRGEKRGKGEENENLFQKNAMGSNQPRGITT